MTDTSLELAATPWLSVARTVSIWFPAATPFNVTLYVELPGAPEAVPTNVVPSKKSTFVTIPSLSLAMALTVIVAGAVKAAPVTGLVIATVGAASTVIVTDSNAWWGNMRAVGDQLFVSHYEWERQPVYTVLSNPVALMSPFQDPKCVCRHRVSKALLP